MSEPMPPWGPLIDVCSPNYIENLYIRLSQALLFIVSFQEKAHTEDAPRKFTF
jgi:hypothetical protein